MPSILRKVKKSRWRKDNYILDLETPDFKPVACLADLKPENNALSVWFVDDTHDNLNEIIIGVASTCQTLDHVEYILLPFEKLPSTIVIKEIGGNTAYPKANLWHRDLIDLTGQGMIKLAAAFLENNSDAIRMPKKSVETLLKQAFKSQELKTDRMHSDLLKNLQATSL